MKLAIESWFAFAGLLLIWTFLILIMSMAGYAPRRDSLVMNATGIAVVLWAIVAALGGIVYVLNHFTEVFR
jgi:hypothetical protein